MGGAVGHPPGHPNRVPRGGGWLLNDRQSHKVPLIHA
eukprot:SAG25_NODE_15406_length_121_cov_45.000000_1_plen_36_part_10